MKKDNYIFIIGLIIGVLLSATGVYAVTQYTSNNIYYVNKNSTLSSNNVQGAIDELATIYKNKKITVCPEGYICQQNLALGDYVLMKPTLSSYTTSTSKTGYTETQTINPQELDLWRVISINDDGTVDIVSEHISSTEVYFQGQTGYQNLVGYLNELASKYENSKYTKGSRYFGYNGQTEYITDTSKFTTTAPWTCSTGESCNLVESQGGGDTGYTKDYNLVKNILGTVIATSPGSSNAEYYWVASRHYSYVNSTTYYWQGRYVYNDGSLVMSRLYSYSSGFSDITRGYKIRPILTLKANIGYTGSGTKADPYQLSETPIKYTISYNANGGSGAPSSQEKAYGKDLTLSSTVPTRSQFKFLGWSTDKNATVGTYNPGSVYTLNKSITLYAIWCIDENYYYIANYDNPRFGLDVAGAAGQADNDGHNVQIYTLGGGEAQRWKFKYNTKGYYNIYTGLGNQTRCLDVDNGNFVNGTNVQIWTCTDIASTEAQRFHLKEYSDGSFGFYGKNNMFLDVKGASFANGVNVQIYNGNDSNAQKWKLISFP